MNYYIIPSSEKLKPFVRFFWVFENEINGDPYIFRSMADGCAELLFHYKGAFNEIKKETNGQTNQPLSLVHSQSSIFNEFITNESFGIFGVYLYPFVLPLLFSLPSTDFVNQTPDLKTLLGQEGKELEEKVMLAADNNQRLKIVSSFLEDKLYKNTLKNLHVASSIKDVIQSNGLCSVTGLAEKYNLSVRQFERKFKEYSGFSPKLYQRIVRFGAALKEYGNDNKTLTEIAYKCGYYDQSHFIHEFKSFSGYHPKEYFIHKKHDAELRII